MVYDGIKKSEEEFDEHFCLHIRYALRELHDGCFTVETSRSFSAILPGVQNYWGQRKMYSECMEKVGRLMLNNLRKFGIL